MKTVTLNYTLVLEVDEALFAHNSFGSALDAGVARIKEAKIHVTDENNAAFEDMAEMNKMHKGFIKALREIG